MKIEKRMNNYIISKNNKSINIQDFNRELYFNNFLLPQGTKYFNTFDNEMLLVIEDEPKKRNIQLSNYENTFYCYFEKKFLEIIYTKDQLWEIINMNSFNLYFPYVIYFIIISLNSCQSSSSIKLFYRTEPLSSYSQDLFYNNLPNNGNNDWFCFKTHSITLKPYDLNNLNIYIKNVLKQFWSTKFTLEIYTCYLNYIKNVVSTDFKGFYDWYVKSKGGPEFILNKNKLIKYPYNLEQSICDYIKYRNKKKFNKFNLKTDINFLYLLPNRIIENGDLIKFNNEEKYFEFCNIKRKIIKFMNDDKIYKFNKNLITDYNPPLNYLKMVEFNGEKIEEGDIIKYREKDVKILKIRKNINDQIEFYLHGIGFINDMENIKIIKHGRENA